MRRRKKKQIRNFIINNLIENQREYIILSILFIIGIVLGIIFINYNNLNQKEEINTYINNYLTQIKENGQILSSTELLKASIQRNLITTIILWLLGLTIIGMPIIYIVIIYKGYSLGYTLASVVAALGFGKGLIFINISILLQYIIYIPCLFFISISGIKLYKSIIRDRNKANIKYEIIRHSIICMIFFVILLIGSLVETYISGGLINSLSKYL